MLVDSERCNELNCCNNIEGLTSDVFCLRNRKTPLNPPENKAYSEKIPIKLKKMEDLRKTMVYIQPENMDFWNEIMNWPTSSVPDEERVD